MPTYYFYKTPVKKEQTGTPTLVIQSVRLTSTPPLLLPPLLLQKGLEQNYCSLLPAL